jgi:hypothetical protein
MGSDFPVADVERGDAERERHDVDAIETLPADERRQGRARRKLLDALVEIGVGVGAVAGDRVAEEGEDAAARERV